MPRPRRGARALGPYRHGKSWRIVLVSSVGKRTHETYEHETDAARRVAILTATLPPATKITPAAALTAAKKIVTYAAKRERSVGRKCELSAITVAHMIVGGCRYCGAKGLTMTLDRIDNARGYTRSNTVPACIRCNLLRRDMPIKAWKLIVPGVRAAFEGGLFGSWMALPPRLGRPPAPTSSSRTAPM